MEYIVFVKTDENGFITAVNSSGFLPHTTGWVEIDRGYGDKYYHAQGNFFPTPIYTDSGAYRYKLVDGVPAECTVAEIAQQEAAMEPEQPDSASNPNVWDELDAAYREGVDSV